MGNQLKIVKFRILIKEKVFCILMKNLLNKINNNFLNIILLKYKDVNTSLTVINNLKHALKIIHIFNINKKIIWFVGFDSLKSFTLSSNHVFLPVCFWVKGLIGNRKFVKFKTKIFNFNKPDLVIILSNKINNEIMKEFVKLDIPIILFNYRKLSIQSCYIKLIPVNLEKKLKSFFFFLVYSVLKKSTKVYAKSKKNIQT